MRAESRPGPRGESATTFPAEWVGEPPTDRAERAVWISRNIEAGERRRAKGERVEWLAERR